MMSLRRSKQVDGFCSPSIPRACRRMWLWASPPSSGIPYGPRSRRPTHWAFCVIRQIRLWPGFRPSIRAVGSGHCPFGTLRRWNSTTYRRTSGKCVVEPCLDDLFSKRRNRTHHGLHRPVSSHGRGGMLPKSIPANHRSRFKINRSIPLSPQPSFEIGILGRGLTAFVWFP